MANLVGDVSSAARILPELNGEKLFIRKGKGARLWDDKGQSYIDTALGFGAVLLGHANQSVNAAVTDALDDSAAPSWAHVREHGAATALARHTGDLTKVMFTNSGSEAVTWPVEPHGPTPVAARLPKWRPVSTAGSTTSASAT
jgi:glutamate-1-semialdehyde 2,1-aminomutase